MANLKLRITKLTIKREQFYTSAEEYCCDSVRKAWDSGEQWLRKEGLLFCPFCGQPIQQLEPDEREVLEDASKKVVVK